MTKENKVVNLKNKIEENKFLIITGKILYAILFIFTIVILIIVLMQRFTNNSISFAGFRMFNIITESMVPKYEVGDILISKKIKPSDIKVGDDITYIGQKENFNGKIVTHQVVAIQKNNGKYIFHTKGIANEIEDPEISEDQVYGKVIYKFWSLSIIGKLMNNVYGFYILIFIPISVLVALKIKEIVKNISENDEEYDEKNRKEKIEKIRKEIERKNGKK